MAPTLKDYEIEYRYYKDGDFGSLNQVIFNSPRQGGGVDFWSLGWLGIDLYSYEQEKTLLNILLEPDHQKEKDEALKRLQELL